MNTTMFTSPLAIEIERFLQYKRTAGCRYLRQEKELRRFDRFLSSHLAGNPVITLDVVRAYAAHGGQQSDSTRVNHISLIRGLCRFLAVEDPRHKIPPRRFLGIHSRPYLQRVLTRDEGRRFITIKDVLGHATIKSTEVYVQTDPEVKRKALEQAGTPSRRAGRPRKITPDLLKWLESL